MTDACPVCMMPTATVENHNTRAHVECSRCGVFGLELRAFDAAINWTVGRNPRFPPEGRFAASHAIRRMQDPHGNSITLSVEQLRALWSEPLPRPMRQLELLVIALGDEAEDVGDWVAWSPERYCAEVGTQDDPRKGEIGKFNFVADVLRKRGWADSESFGAMVDKRMRLRLTFEGWIEYDRLRREVVDSKTAFMAMSFSNTGLASVVSDHFMPAVRETGFELYRLDSRPKSGLIDIRMRVEIRAAKFLVCDLTDENRGAYWEAGFAEGAGKPVFYTCEADKFDATRTHFDTEHMLTIKWRAENPSEAALELQATIRNEFPAEAVPPDLARGRS